MKEAFWGKERWAAHVWAVAKWGWRTDPALVPDPDPNPRKPRCRSDLLRSAPPLNSPIGTAALLPCVNGMSLWAGLQSAQNCSGCSKRPAGLSAPGGLGLAIYCPLYSHGTEVGNSCFFLSTHPPPTEWCGKGHVSHYLPWQAIYQSGGMRLARCFLCSFSGAPRRRRWRQQQRRRQEQQQSDRAPPTDLKRCFSMQNKLAPEHDSTQENYICLL